MAGSPANDSCAQAHSFFLSGNKTACCHIINRPQKYNLFL
jgi:hypothetical protein